jgi:hypothetical protein
LPIRLDVQSYLWIGQIIDFFSLETEQELSLLCNRKSSVIKKNKKKTENALVQLIITSL